ncbi:MAG: hypothetical protein GQ523_05160 [Methanophagales archaeon]|nr:hypothetical protein [Methanophagales archaeon]
MKSTAGGCGTCIDACPVDAIELEGVREPQIISYKNGI